MTLYQQDIDKEWFRIDMKLITKCRYYIHQLSFRYIEMYIKYIIFYQAN